MATLDMTPEPLDIIVKRGMTWEWGILWLDEQDAPINNTGYDFQYEMRIEPDGDTVLVLSTADCITAAGSTGYINFLVPTASTALTSQRYVFSLVCDTGTKTLPVAEGTVTVEE